MARRRLPRSLPAAELKALLAAAPAGRDSLILQCGVYMGLRCSELTRLEVSDLDLDAGLCLVRQAKGDRDRSVPVPSRLAGELQAWLAGRTTGHVFPGRGGRRLSSRTVQRVIKRAAIAAGLPEAELPRKIHPHRLRHTFATRCLRAGADIIEVRDLLGHASVATTQVYLSADSSRLKSAVERAAEDLP